MIGRSPLLPARGWHVLGSEKPIFLPMDACPADLHPVHVLYNIRVNGTRPPSSIRFFNSKIHLFRSRQLDCPIAFTPLARTASCRATGAHKGGDEMRKVNPSSRRHPPTKDRQPKKLVYHSLAIAAALEPVVCRLDAVPAKDERLATPLRRSRMDKFRGHARQGWGGGGRPPGTCGGGGGKAAASTGGGGGGGIVGRPPIALIAEG